MLSTIYRYAHKAATLPPKVVAQKILRKLTETSRLSWARYKDRFFSTYLHVSINEKQQLVLKLQQLVLPLHNGNVTALCSQVKQLMAHHFDLLGSGNVKVAHGCSYAGFEGYSYSPSEIPAIDTKGNWLTGRINRANCKRSKAIWRMVGTDYQPIDWHVDFRSGYRWSEKTWYRDIPVGHLPGVDIKLPWELARMQHLPLIALAFRQAIEGSRDLDEPEKYRCEVRNQILDFIANNPPRYGVNWACTMDVGIRAVNLLLTYDLICSAGGKFDQSFNTVFKSSIWQHGQHILSNLEWSEELRGNHYLADIVGLLFISAYFINEKEPRAWFAFAVQEFLKEIELQFGDDGANFEGSINYHRLSTEMVLYGLALIVGMSDSPKPELRHYDHKLIGGPVKLVPANYNKLIDEKGRLNLNRFSKYVWLRLERMAEFIVDISRPDNSIPQIGDTDNGRLVNFDFAVPRRNDSRGERPSFSIISEHSVDNESYRSLANQIFEWFGYDHNRTYAPISQVEGGILKCLNGGQGLTKFATTHQRFGSHHVRIGTGGIWHELEASRTSQGVKNRQSYRFISPGGGLRESLQLAAYADFGIYIFRTNRFYLAFRCGSIGQNGNGGHDHNDQLGIELFMNGELLIRDPGTYTYTADPDLRNRYRSVDAHFVPRVKNREPAGFSQGLFCLTRAVSGNCLYFGEKGVIGTHRGYGFPVYRKIEISDNSVTIDDWSEGQPVERLLSPDIAFSPGYGLKDISESSLWRLEE